MIKCTQLFLKHGLITSDFVNLNIRKLIMETNPEFVEWCGLTPKGSDPNPYLVTNEWFYSYDLYRQFIEDNPEFGKLSLKPRTFNRWIVSYCMYKEGLEPEKKKTNKKTMMRIRPKSEGITQQKLM